MTNNTPSVEQVEKLYSLAYAWRAFDDVEEGETNLQPMRESQRAEFRRMIADVRAKAWEEGFKACAEWWEIHHWQHSGAFEDNPYKEAP